MPFRWLVAIALPVSDECSELEQSTASVGTNVPSVPYFRRVVSGQLSPDTSWPMYTLLLDT